MSKPAFKKIGNVLAAILMAVEILLIVFIIFNNVGGKATIIFGYQISHVVTPSMEPEIMVGDVIISKKYDGGELKIGDVVTYIGKEDSFAGKMITHKVIEVDGDAVVTKGIANDSADPSITKSDVISVMVYKPVVLGKIYRAISSVWGFVLILIVPLLVMIVSEIFEIRRCIREETEGESNNEKDDNQK